MSENVLYYGDNLDILQRYIKDESVDLIYLDPPFKSNQDYNVLFAEKNGSKSKSQIKAFEDTWIWDEAAVNTYAEMVQKGPERVSQALQGFRKFVGPNDMLAYLSMMAPRLIQLKRVLKPTGGIFLHCDPTASHYLKVLMDAVFGGQNFRNEVVWHYGQRTAFHRGHFSRKHDIILFYAKSKATIVNKVEIRWKKEDFLKHRHDVKRDEDGEEYIYSDGGKKGVRYLRPVEEVLVKGKPLDSVWDIPLLNASAKERLGYPTQKPEVLLERIVKASSNEGDVVLDPFCGCGTTVAVAQKLDRQWIGIDITHLAITLIKHRLQSAYGDKVTYEVVGEPVSLPDAKALAKQDPYQFQWWALGLVGARPVEQKKGADKGIDGRLYFHDDIETDKTKQIILQVKSGHVGPALIRDLRGVLEREKAEMGVFVTLEKPTKSMRAEAASAGFYHSPWQNKKHPKLQIITITDLLEGKKIDSPPLRQVDRTFKKAPKAKGKKDETNDLPLE